MLFSHTYAMYCVFLYLVLIAYQEPTTQGQDAAFKYFKFVGGMVVNLTPVTCYGLSSWAFILE